MTLNTNKNNSEIQYYCTENGATIGPLNLPNLLEKINSDTLVYREGIEWTNAKDIEELSKFFKLKEPVNNTVNTNENSSELQQGPIKMFAAPFSFEGRIRRTEFGVSVIIYAFINLIVAYLAEGSGFFLVGYIPAVWFLWAQGAKRCHDRGNSGWYQLIPFYGFWMLFADSDNGVNEYGNKPK